MAEFGSSPEVAALGVSLFVLGFAISPALWAPLSELYGRKILFVITHGVVVAFVAATAGCNPVASLLVFRFLAGTFGASTMTNSGGVVADLFPLLRVPPTIEDAFATKVWLGWQTDNAP